jgi:Family of unknown function (DUF6221)
VTDDLVEWLRAQLAVDQEKARAVAELRSTWHTGGGYEETGPTKVLGEDGYVIVEDDTDWAAEIVAHIALHDPARVLRDVAAIRKIVDWVDGELADDAEQVMPRLIGQYLAAIFDDRPGYQEEWRP